MLKQAKRVYEFGPFRLDATERQLWRHDEIIPLTPKAYETLLLFVANSGHVLEKDELMRAIWPDTFVEEANLAHNISLLRRALGESPGEQRYIQTVPRRGYRFLAEVRKPEEPEEEESGGLGPPAAPSAADESGSPFLPRGGAADGLAKAKRRVSRVTLAVVCLLLVGAGVAAYWWAKRSTPGPRLRTLAVLPFKPLVAGDRDESLEMGMAETLITKLGNVSGIVVRPVGAVRRYNSLEQDPVAAGRELGVDAVLDGSIQRGGERVRVTVRLVSVQKGRPLWADRLDGKFTDIFALEDAISERVAAALSVRLSESEQERLKKHYTDDTEAYQEYVKGRHHWNRRTEEGQKKAIEHFRRAIEKDPDYALAYAGSAECHYILGDYIWARAYATRALEIDDTVAEAHTALASIKLHQDWDFVGAESGYKRAIDLNPGYATAYQRYSLILTYLGRTEESLAAAKRAVELDPVSLSINSSLGSRLYFARRYDEAVEQLRRTLELDPDFATARIWLGRSLLQKGMNEEAVAELSKALALSPGGEALAALGRAYAASGKRGEAGEVLRQLGEISKPRDVSPVTVAEIYAALGDKDQAFAWLEKGSRERTPRFINLKVNPAFDSLRTDPRYADLLQRIGLAEHVK